MGRVARVMVQSSSIDVDQLVEKLVAAAVAELTTFYRYTILRVNALGLGHEGLNEVVEDARIEDRNHFDALVPRIYELGGELPGDLRDFAAAELSASPPSPGDKALDLLAALVEDERCAIRTYTDICNLTAGKDHRTYELSLAILNEEIEHEAWLSPFLDEAPPSRFGRTVPGTAPSPYMDRFMPPAANVS